MTDAGSVDRASSAFDFDDLDAFYDYADEHRWTDGLPVVPPTPERVSAMVAASDRPRLERVGLVAPRYGDATIEVVAVNAVMAGCRPEYMPVVLTALRGILDPAFELASVQTTTHPCAVMILVSGPVSADLGISGEAGCLGPGPTFRANQTIGRAVRLILLNAGGAYPQLGDMATQGTPAKLSFCFAENAEANPWEPFHVAQGFPQGTSTVTVAAAEGPHNLNDHVSDTAEGLLTTFSQSIATMGKNNAYLPESDFFVILAPEHAGLLARSGWSRPDVQEYLFQHARIPVHEWRRGGMFGMFPSHQELDGADDEAGVAMTRRADNIHLVVAGGAGRHSSWVPTLAGNGLSVTVPVEGTPGGVTGHRERRLDTIATLLHPMVDVLRADGYDLEVRWAPHSELLVSVTAGPDACADCLVPSSMFRDMVVERLERGGESIPPALVRVSYPPK